MSTNSKTIGTDPCSWSELFELNLPESHSDMEDVQKALDENGYRWQEWQGCIYFKYFVIERNGEDSFTVYIKTAGVYYPFLCSAATEVVIEFIENTIEA